MKRRRIKLALTVIGLVVLGTAVVNLYRRHALRTRRYTWSLGVNVPGSASREVPFNSRGSDDELVAEFAAALQPIFGATGRTGGLGSVRLTHTDPKVARVFRMHTYEVVRGRWPSERVPFEYYLQRIGDQVAASRTLDGLGDLLVRDVLLVDMRLIDQEPIMDAMLRDALADESRIWRRVWLVECGVALLALGLASAFWTRRPKPGVCPACGYDLRGSTGRCPECGAERPAATP